MSGVLKKSLCCTWSHRANLPASIKEKFGELDQVVKEVISAAKSRLLIVAPYISAGGLKLIREPLITAINNGAWVRVVTADLDANNHLNRKGFEALFQGDLGRKIRDRTRVLLCTDKMPVLFHAKIIVADSQLGYMGSANLSVSALADNFEIGSTLLPPEAEALDRLIDFLEAENFIKETSLI
jgi:phosphatidylserine/phosphatidylglycerophosphate/cardiolipin synthase-like enzyme